MERSLKDKMEDASNDMLSLSDQATFIMNQEFRNLEDIINLANINYEFSKLYRNALIISAKQESLYNKHRSTRQAEGITAGAKVSQAEALAKQEAEERYGDYRTMNATARGMKAEIDAIQSMIVQRNVENKATEQAIRQGSSG